LFRRGKSLFANQADAERLSQRRPFVCGKTESLLLDLSAGHMWSMA